jgi:hypothetical protein
VNKRRLSESLEDPYAIFVFAMNAAQTREKYITRLDRFFYHINVQGNTMQERCRCFAEIAKKDNKWVLNNILRFFANLQEGGSGVII